MFQLAPPLQLIGSFVSGVRQYFSFCSDGDDEFSMKDDASVFEISCEGEEAWSTINSVNVLPATEVTSNEIFELTEDARHTDNNACNVDAVDEPTVRGQIDIGCSASCTGNREMLHDYAEFSREHPSPMRLSPAAEGSDALPEGWGCLKVPAHNEVGCLKVQTYYHPQLRTTLFDERDFYKAAGHVGEHT